MTLGFAKLDEGFPDSSLWVAAVNDPPLLLVWTLLLCRADSEGFARIAVPAIAFTCNLTTEQARKYLDMLQAPDPDSRDDADEGRRIAAVPGGFMLLNYAKYRAQRDPETRREQVREAVRRFRAKKLGGDVSQPVIKCKHPKPKKAQAEAEAEAEAETESVGVRTGDSDITPPESNQSSAKADRESREAAMAVRDPRPILTSKVAEVFAYWVAVMGKNPATSILTPERDKNVRARIAQGYTVIDLKNAILGCSMDPFSMGQNDRGKKFNDLELICRDGKHVEDFRDVAIAGGPESSASARARNHMQSIVSGAMAGLLPEKGDDAERHLGGNVDPARKLLPAPGGDAGGH